MECPHCHSRDYIYSDYRRRFDWLFSIFGFTSFSCRNCYQMFFEFHLLPNLRHWLSHEVFRIRYIPDWQASPSDSSERAPEYSLDGNWETAFDSVFMKNPQELPAPEALALKNSNDIAQGDMQIDKR
jgi:hypothetical protein